MKCNKRINNNFKGIFCNLAFKNNKYKKGIIIILGLIFINCCDYKITNSTLEANKEEKCSYCQSCLKKKIVFCGKEFPYYCLACLFSSLGAITAGGNYIFFMQKNHQGILTK